MENVLIPFFSPISDKTSNEKILTSVQRGGWNTISPTKYISLPKKKQEELNFWIFIGTGGTENSVIKFLDEVHPKTSPILVSHNLSNSLPAAMEIRRYLEEMGHRTRIIHDTIENLSDTLDQETLFSSVSDKLQTFRLGLIGNQSEWLVASDIDREAVKKLWGLEIIQIPISEVIDNFSEESNAEISVHGQNFSKFAQKVDRSSKHLKEARIVASALQEIHLKYHLNAFSIECFSIIQQTESTACFALSYFNDNGLVAGCEGDLPSAFSMILIKLLVDQPSFMANISSVNSENKTAILSHCTVPIEMTEKFEVFSHYESKKGVAIRGVFEVGKTVTILKVAGKTLSEWYISTGTIVQNHTNEECCRTQVEVHFPDSVTYFLKNSLANHHIMVLGDHKSRIESFLKDKLIKK